VNLGATDNLTGGNQAHNNGGPFGGLDDLVDGNHNCDNNTWKQNSFGSANQPCIN
jgi:hypothetical protein